MLDTTAPLERRCITQSERVQTRGMSEPFLLGGRKDSVGAAAPLESELAARGSARSIIQESSFHGWKLTGRWFAALPVASAPRC